jgi:dTDP-4-dehydrorhamnose reductase
MRLLVTGAAGMLGQDVVRAGRDAGHDVVGLAREELDITDSAAVDSTVRAARPDRVLNCAAFTDVDGAESRPEDADRVNRLGAGVVAAAAAVTGAAVVQISTDYVFDGTASRPYVESDVPNPLSAYGRTKLAGERAVAAANERHAIVRSSWLFGAGGPNFVATMLRLARGRDEVSVVTDQVGCPTWTGHLACALVALCSRFAPGIHHVAGADECSWHDFAREIFAQAGATCRVLPASSADLDRRAPRPAYSVLHSERDETPRLPPWQDGLAAYLATVAGVAAT